MPHASLNPATNQVLKTFPSWDAPRLQQALEQARRAQEAWAQTAFVVRAGVLREASIRLHAQCDRFASLMTLEMGKLLREARVAVSHRGPASEAGFWSQRPRQRPAGSMSTALSKLGMRS